MHINRPRGERLLADIEGDAYFARRPIAMALKHIAAFVHPEVRIGRQQPQSAMVFYSRPQVFQQTVECRIAIVARRLRDLPIGREQPACELGMGIGPEKCD